MRRAGEGLSDIGLIAQDAEVIATSRSLSEQELREVGPTSAD
ncbi:hypothetical protein [Bythopirellula goksoeyrii]|uniref:Uncharacterized protein n=1 Tax=Bythopirellula goksoeyrii TaxID=1400387 RepID=A0A5B9QES3_9BACT|nr:hypothetical protein [Bythopirellula goksoeyrii]QEG36140.1 hypothetical protein Pr1d_34490 [Bythopirellula goksoeyrii]